MSQFFGLAGYGVSTTPLVPDNSYEQGIVDKHSPPSLRRNVLTRSAKRFYLEDGKRTPVEVNQILDELYPNDGKTEGQVRS